MKRDAVISDCGLYRYRLDRVWDERGIMITWVMLNPSTADAEVDDPTIRRCIRFSQDWGYGGLSVVNVYALRATDPREIARAGDPFGPDYARYFGDAITLRPVVAAWGVHAGKDGRALADILRDGKHTPLAGPPLCLGTTKDGSPRHPLYVRADTLPIPFVPVGEGARNE